MRACGLRHDHIVWQREQSGRNGSLAQRLDTVGHRAGLNEGDLFRVHALSFDEFPGDNILERCQAVYGHGFSEQIFYAANLWVGNHPKERPIVSDMIPLNGSPRAAATSGPVMPVR